jgi:hypothetical protein
LELEQVADLLYEEEEKGEKYDEFFLCLAVHE